MTTSTGFQRLGTTQQRLLRLLLTHEGGTSIESMVEELGITTTAVRQHLSALQRDGLVAKAGTVRTGRRPRTMFALSERGRELFPRHYDLMAEKVIEQTREVIGPEALIEIMRHLGTEAARDHSLGTAGTRTSTLTHDLAKALNEAGYEAEPDGDRQHAVVAYNCVFHRLATRFPEVCEYDLALIRGLTGMSVHHEECIVRGGGVCRFILEKTRT